MFTVNRNLYDVTPFTVVVNGGKLYFEVWVKTRGADITARAVGSSRPSCGSGRKSETPLLESRYANNGFVALSGESIPTTL